MKGAHIDVIDAIPLRRRHRDDRRVREDPGAIDQQIELAERGDGRGDDTLDLRFLGDVGGQRRDRRVLAERGGHGREAGGVMVGGDHPVAERDEGPDDRGPDPPGGTGDEHVARSSHVQHSASLYFGDTSRCLVRSAGYAWDCRRIRDGLRAAFSWIAAPSYRSCHVRSCSGANACLPLATHQIR